MSELRPRSDRSVVKTTGIARHGRLRKAGPWGAILAFLGASVVVVLVSGAALAGIVVNQLNNNLKPGVELVQPTDAPPPSVGAYPGGFNMLIVGSDKCEEDDGCSGRGSANLNDVTMLLHVSADGTNATAVSFPRDLVVPYPSCPRVDKDGNQTGAMSSPMTGRPINETLYYGGLACTVLTVEALTGLKIQFAGLITFNGVIKMSNAVGGVPVCFAGPVKDDKTGLDMAAGTHTLKGWQALAFLRSRHGVGDGSDLTRISSQQVFLSSLVRTLKSKDTLGDPLKVYALAQAATSSMELSSGLRQLDNMLSIAAKLKDIPLEAVTFVQFPGVTGQGGIYQGKVAPVQYKVDQLFSKIRADEPFALASVGDGNGSVVDPNAEPVTPDPAATGAPLEKLNISGQTAADATCSNPF
ncbi:LytR family transcriptional regulator [Glaciihabitans arcticus]|uniref:LytR family transcriptional regulator n=1 Tax=Glaciihabitans arcticus TaxID=2668039 RepID=A0A4Q9H0R5_9MICO|nr:LCP family protein [Glaciihabitans arcticus]TBN58290.1 LytR family transcriptional regulator [Glaciihabitans arcticus]